MALKRKLFTPGPGGSILKAKIFGLPAPVVALGAGVVGVIAYRKFAGGGGGGGADSSGAGTTPSDYSGGSPGGGGGAGDYSGGTGEQGSSFDEGGGVTGGGGFITGPGPGAGGAFVPATQAPGVSPQPVRLFSTVVIRPRAKKGQKRRPAVVNRLVVGGAGNLRLITRVNPGGYTSKAAGRGVQKHRVPVKRTPPIRRKSTSKTTTTQHLYG